MNNSLKFNEFRKKYKFFYYNSYSLREDENAIYLEFEFEIPDLVIFKPKTKILKKKMPFKNLDTIQAKNIAFNIGLIELISYWKAVCPPQIVIKCGFIDEKQIKWWKKLYFYGLGELFYTNGIHISFEDFVNIKCEKYENEFANIKEDNYEEIKNEKENLEGYIVPIGGGKDSIVTLETLPIDPKMDYCLIINPKPVTLKCAEIAGFEDNNIIEIYRNIDQNLINLNSKGMINGHTPFSAMLAFTSYLVAFLLSKKYVALSNESSANESNLLGEKINHQYSKSYEFEKDFREYADQFLNADVEYFSFLRPLNELQIAKIFSKYEKYHTTFKSCNAGSKDKEWKWCLNCAKCLFAYTILSPYLYKEKLLNIFGEDMFQNKNLLKIFLELNGKEKTKPFDCVGTFEEVNYATSKTISKLLKENKELPYLLKYYYDNFGLVDLSEDITKRYNYENFLTKEQNNILRKEVL